MKVVAGQAKAADRDLGHKLSPTYCLTVREVGQNPYFLCGLDECSGYSGPKISLCNFVQTGNCSPHKGGNKVRDAVHGAEPHEPSEAQMQSAHFLKRAR